MIVQTSEGFEWICLCDGSWLDSASGLIWLPEEKGRFKYSDAVEMQNALKRLPTKEEWEEAEKHRIREIFEMKNKLFWVASVHPSYSYCYYFDGNNGDIDNDLRYYDHASVRCVSR